jgi:uncharacterized protein (DUF302 family)
MRTEIMRDMALALAGALLILAAMAAPADAGNATPYPGTKIIKTGHSYKDLVGRLDAAVKANKMGLVTRASATVGAKAKLNKVIPGNMVVGVYRPDFAVRMLEASVPAGIEAPLRFYITENPDGTATLTYRAPSAVFAPYEVPALDAMAKELDPIFAKIAADATGE